MAREHAQHAMRAGTQPLDDPALIRRGALLGARDARKHAFAPPQWPRRLVLPRNDQDRGRRLLPLPFDGTPQQVAIRVLAEDFEHRHLGQRAGGHIGLPAALFDHAFVFELAQDLLERVTLGALQFEHLREVAFGVAGMRREIFENRILGDGSALLQLRFFSHGICRKTVSI